MTSKRPSIDLMALTSEAAMPMREASQRVVDTQPSGAPAANDAKLTIAARPTPTANLEALAFKVPPVFRKRFKSRAVAADMKLNELLFAALDAWEEKQRIKG